MSIWRAPFNFADHDLDKSMQNFGGMSATTISITKLYVGIWVRETIESFTKPEHFTLLESKEKRTLYGLVVSNSSLSIITFGIKLCDAPESNIALCRIRSCTFKLTYKGGTSTSCKSPSTFWPNKSFGWSSFKLTVSETSHVFIDLTIWHLYVSLLISSLNGIDIFILDISFWKLKDDWPFSTSLMVVSLFRNFFWRINFLLTRIRCINLAFLWRIYWKFYVSQIILSLHLHDFILVPLLIIF